MDKIEVIMVHDDYGHHIVRTEDGQIGTAALELLKQRIKEGGWYYHPDGAQSEAQQIVASGDGNAAWRFLFTRRDYEYEWVEAQTI